MSAYPVKKFLLHYGCGEGANINSDSQPANSLFSTIWRIIHALPMPLAAAQMDAVHVLSKVAKAETLQTEATLQLNALLPSILSHAFAGQF